MFSLLMCTLFLMAIVAANLAVTNIGIAALPYTAFILIPFDLVTRDVLHDRWKGKNLYLKMGLLIATGGILSLIINSDSKLVAIASMTAFTSAGIIDTLVYSLLHEFHRAFKMNISNLFSSITDSLIFPLIAFGGINSQIAIGQSSSKFFGGIVWSFIFILVLKSLRKRSTVELNNFNTLGE